MGTSRLESKEEVSLVPKLLLGNPSGEALLPEAAVIPLAGHERDEDGEEPWGRGRIRGKGKWGFQAGKQELPETAFPSRSLGTSGTIYGNERTFRSAFRNATEDVPYTGPPRTNEP
uniref:Uncharacterized protein n=1 Tax=Candidatus Kentrum sp. FW TaxID=2126338 RepID=A0A450T305_9GAMM|nr:MAG: hypothetical protein BECKFW1821A_GA0114235_110913 [Candidatus Kentron sp. FW]